MWSGGGGGGGGGAAAASGAREADAGGGKGHEGAIALVALHGSRRGRGAAGAVAGRSAARSDVVQRRAQGPSVCGRRRGVVSRIIVFKKGLECVCVGGGGVLLAPGRQ